VEGGLEKYKHFWEETPKDRPPSPRYYYNIRDHANFFELINCHLPAILKYGMVPYGRRIFRKVLVNNCPQISNLINSKVCSIQSFEARRSTMRRFFLGNATQV
jgi:hypothetical protein